MKQARAVSAMWRAWLVLVAVSVAGCGRPSSPTLPPGVFAYVGIRPGLIQYMFDTTTGAFTPTGSVAEISSGRLAQRPVVGSSGRYVYCVTVREESPYLSVERYVYSLSGFSVGVDGGALKGIFEPFKVGEGKFAPPPLALVDPSGQFLYLRSSDFKLAGYAIDALTGTLVSLGELLPSRSVRSMALDPRGRFLYAALGGDLVTFRIDPARGFLTVAAALEGHGASYMVVSSSGEFVYTLSGPAVRSYKVDAETGALSPAGEAATSASGDEPQDLVSSGRFLYAVDKEQDDVSGYVVDQGTGALRSLGALVQVDGLDLVTVDPSGGFLFLGEYSVLHDFQLVAYGIDPASGRLSRRGPAVPGYTVAFVERR